jgi:hypothetical protein
MAATVIGAKLKQRRQMGKMSISDKWVLVCVFGIATWLPHEATGQCTSVNASLVPIEDAFVRALVPTINYGSAGALAVAGDAAVNGASQPQGRFESVMKWDIGPAVAAFNTAYGVGNWTISAARLVVTEVSVANNAIFNRGLGDFTVVWLSDDNWVEGPGSPLSLPPHVGVGNEMTWDYLQALLVSASQSSLGVFSNQLVDGTRTFHLALSPPLLADIQSGGMVSLHLAPVTTTVGFTFFGSDYGVFANWPTLELSAKRSLADMNCDGVRNLADINAFVMALLDPAQFALAYPGCNIAVADVNSDGTVDGDDIPGLLCAVVP